MGLNLEYANLEDARAAMCIINDNNNEDLSDEKIAELKQILSENPALLEGRSTDEGKFTLLFIATVGNKYKAVQYLLEAGADAEIPDNIYGNTPLLHAVLSNNSKMTSLLLSNSRTSIEDIRNKHGNSLIGSLLSSPIAPEIIPLLFKKGWDIYDNSNDGPLKRAIYNTISPEVFNALLLKEPILQKLFFLAREGKLVPKDPNFPPYTHLRSTTSFQELLKLEYAINCIHLFCINHHYSDATPILFDYLQKLSTYKRVSFKPESYDAFLKNPVWKMRIFDLEPEVKTCFDQIVSLFEKPQRCIELLKELNSQIAELASTFDFTKITPGAGLTLYADLRAPSPLANSSVLIPDTHSLLRYLLRLKLNKYGIETQESSNIFSGFVDSTVANDLVKRGELFTEQAFMGVSIMHGRKMHMIQLYLMARGIEEGDIKLPNNVTLRDLLALMVSAHDKDSNSLWETLIDSVVNSPLEHSPYHYYLGSPHRLNSLLLLCSELPHLRGCLLNSWYKHMNKFQDFILQHHKVALSYESLVQGEAFARNRFNGLDLGHTNKDISAYYRDKAKSRLTTDITVNETTGIVTKNAAKQFAVIAGLFKRQSAMACNKSAVAPTEDLTTGM